MQQTNLIGATHYPTTVGASSRWICYKDIMWDYKCTLEKAIQIYHNQASKGNKTMSTCRYKRCDGIIFVTVSFHSIDPIDMISNYGSKGEP